MFDGKLVPQQKQPPEYSMKKGVLGNFTKFTGKNLCQSLFFNKVAVLCPATLLKKIRLKTERLKTQRLKTDKALSFVTFYMILFLICLVLSNISLPILLDIEAAIHSFATD